MLALHVYTYNEYEKLMECQRVERGLSGGCTVTASRYAFARQLIRGRVCGRYICLRCSSTMGIYDRKEAQWLF